VHQLNHWGDDYHLQHAHLLDRHPRMQRHKQLGSDVKAATMHLDQDRFSQPRHQADTAASSYNGQEHVVMGPLHVDNPVRPVQMCTQQVQWFNTVHALANSQLSRHHETQCIHAYSNAEPWQAALAVENLAVN